MSHPIRIVLADDHADVRKSIRRLLTTCPQFDVVGEAADGAAAVRLAAELAPDVVVMDIQMPVMDGIEATKVITAGEGAPKVVGLSASDQQAAYGMLTAGASEFVVKGRAFMDLESVIKRLFPPQPSQRVD